MSDNKRNARFSVFNKRVNPLDYQSLAEERKLSLPEDFAEKVLEYESCIDRGEFTSEDLNDLILNYSQAVEYYNSFNSSKASYYADRIQLVLMKPQVLDIMKLEVQDPMKAAEKAKEIKLKREKDK